MWDPIADRAWIDKCVLGFTMQNQIKVIESTYDLVLIDYGSFLFFFYFIFLFLDTGDGYSTTPFPRSTYQCLLMPMNASF